MNRPLLLVALGTAPALITYATLAVTMLVAASDPIAGIAAKSWILSALRVGLAGGLLAAELLDDKFARRHVYLAGLLSLISSAVFLGAALAQVRNGLSQTVISLVIIAV